MKQKVFGLLAAGLALGMTACNNSGDSTGNNDSTNAGTTVNSTGNYAARADSVKMNVSAGNYLNPRTGQAYTNLSVDQSTGRLTDESGRPVRRYVDKRTWWVYDANTWDTVGSARMQNNSLWYMGDNGDWVEYDKRWTDDMMDTTGSGSGNGTMDTSNSSTSSSGSGNTKVSDNGNKTKDGNVKVKVSDKGDKLKVKKTDN